MSTPTEHLSSNTLQPALGDVPSPSFAIDPNNPPWGVPAAVFVLVGSLLALVALPTLAQVAYIFFVYAGAGFSMESLEVIAQQDKTFIFVSILATFPAHLLTLALAWGVVTGNGKRPFFASLGWSWTPGFRLWTCVGLAVGIYLLAFALLQLVGGDKTQIDLIIESSIQSRFALAALATLTAPLVEEVVYRGVVFSALQRVMGTLWTVACVVALFTLIHIPQYITNIAVIGVLALLSLVLTLVRAKTGRLLPCFVIHLVFNGVQAILIVLAPYFPQSPPN